MITVDSDESSVVVRVPREDLPPERLNAFIEWMRLESVARKSQLTEGEADRLADDVKAGWWQENKARFVPDPIG